MKFLFFFVLLIVGFIVYVLFFTKPTMPAQVPAQNQTSTATNPAPATPQPSPEERKAAEEKSEKERKQAEADKKAKDEQQVKELAAKQEQEKKEREVRLAAFRAEKQNISLTTPVKSLYEALRQAAAQDKLVFYRYGNAQCPYCIIFNKYIKEGKVKVPAKYFIYVEIELNDKDSKENTISYFNETNQIYFPYICIMDGYDRILGISSGDKPVEEFNRFITESFLKKESSPPERIFKQGMPNVSVTGAIQDLDTGLKNAKAQNKRLYFAICKKTDIFSNFMRKSIANGRIFLPSEYFTYAELDNSNRAAMESFAHKFNISGSIKIPAVYIIAPDGKIVGSRGGGTQITEYNNFIADTYRKYKNP